MPDEKVEVPEIEPKDLDKALKSDDKPFILDVREEDEYKICHIKGAILIPLMTLFDRYTEVPNNRPVVVMCHTGRRSARAVSYLQEKGYLDVRNLIGGIELWADEIDHEMPKY